MQKKYFTVDEALEFLNRTADPQLNFLDLLESELQLYFVGTVKGAQYFDQEFEDGETVPAQCSEIGYFTGFFTLHKNTLYKLNTEKQTDVHNFILPKDSDIRPKDIDLNCDVYISLENSLSVSKNNLVLDAETILAMRPQVLYMTADLPTELRVALEIFREGWEGLPDDMRRPTLDDIKDYLTRNGYQLSKQARERINTITRPDGERVGAHSKARIFKWRSERKK